MGVDNYGLLCDILVRGSAVSLAGSLNVRIIDDIVNCLFVAEADNLAPVSESLLRPPLQDSLLKLKERFQKDR